MLGATTLVVVHDGDARPTLRLPDRHQCRWPFNDPRLPKFRYCCEAVVDVEAKGLKSRYCGVHAWTALSPALREAVAPVAVAPSKPVQSARPKRVRNVGGVPGRQPTHDDDVIRWLHAEGHAGTEIARRLNLATSNVSRTLRRLGLKPNVMPRRRRAAQPEQAAA